MVAVRRALVVSAVVGSAVIVVRRVRLKLDPHRALASLRTSSMPSASAYERLLGGPMGGFYDLVAREVTALAEAGTVLEIGPGPGHLAVRLARMAPGIAVVGVDLDPAMVERAAARANHEGVADRVTFVTGDVAALPQADASVDLVVSTMSFHHWADPVAGLREIHRVLRPGGRALVYDLTPWWTRIEGNRLLPEVAAAASPFRGGEIVPVRWPGPLRVSRRLTLVKPPAPAPARASDA